MLTKFSENMKNSKLFYTYLKTSQFFLNNLFPSKIINVLKFTKMIKYPRCECAIRTRWGLMVNLFKFYFVCIYVNSSTSTPSTSTS